MPPDWSTKKRGDHRNLSYPAIKQFPDGEQGCFEVQGVERCLAKQKIDPAFDQGFGLLRVGLEQPLEVDSTNVRAIRIDHDRRAAIAGANGTGDPSGALRSCELVAGSAGDARRHDVHFPNMVFQTEIRLSHRVCGERGRFHNIGPRSEVGFVDLLNQFRRVQQQGFRVVAQVERMLGETISAITFFGRHPLLQEDAHGTVEDQNPIADGLGKGVGHRSEYSIRAVSNRDRPRLCQPLYADC